MAKATHNLVVKSGEYTDQDGRSRNRWQRIGSVFRHDDGGTTIKLDCVPVGLPDWDGWVSVFSRDEPQDSAGQKAQTTRQAANGYQGQNSNVGTGTGPLQGPDDFDDDIPF